jgi:UDP-N-acetylmuramate dehydrogenase
MMLQEQSNTFNHPLIKQDVSLKDKNWFQTGGSARFFAEPFDTQSFSQALSFAQNNNLAVFILGQGANILISDEGFDGLVIRPRLHALRHEPGEKDQVFVHAQAGVTMHDLIEYCLDHNIVGLEEFSGIPGTVGGSVYINLHYFQFLLEHFLHQAQVINRHTGTIYTVDKSWFNFGYNTSTLQKLEYYLVSATFALKSASDLEIMYARGRRAEIIRHRHARYPVTHTCGSFFRNFHPDEVPYFIDGTQKKLIFVAYYLDKIGVKGALRVGDAIVSHQHANMLVNKGNATSNDLIKLARIMQERVKDTFGIIPQPECQLIGFKEYPLL